MNNDFGIADNSFHLILDCLTKVDEIEKAVIFGSRAMGNFKMGSDIDIAIFGERITFETVSRLYGKLNEGLPIPYFVDVVNYHTLELESLKHHIQSEGKEIFKK
jgi:predicted nucleotidyltransferase